MFYQVFREIMRYLAWVLFILAVGSTWFLMATIHSPPRIEEQFRILFLSSLCWYGWWRLK